MKKLVYFGCGLLVGLSFLLLPISREKKESPVEKALAQIIYQKIDRYQNDIELDSVLALVKKYTQIQLPFVDEQELYGPILELDEKYAVAESLAAQQKAENY